MAALFEENDSYSDSENEEDFSGFLSEIEENENEDEFENDDEFEDDDELENVDELEDDELSSEEVDIPSENEVIVELHDGQAEVEESLLDALLGKALAGDQMNSRIEGLFEDLDSSVEPDIIDRSELEDVDSGISVGAVSSSSAETQASDAKCKNKDAFDMSSLKKYMQYITEEEHAVSVEDIPDFASKKNVYGTSFNVRNGIMSRPPRFEFARHDQRWIDSCVSMAYEKDKTLKELITLGKLTTTVKAGAKIEFRTKFTDVHIRSADEINLMETHDIQQIIRDALNSKRLAVVLFGIGKDGKVTGCHMGPGQQDNLRLALDTAVQTEFAPPIENILDVVDMNFVPVEEMDETFLIVIRVKQLRNQVYRLESSV